MKRLIFLLLTILLLLCGCAGEQEASAPPELPSGSVITIGKDAQPYTEDALFLQLFDLGNKISFQETFDDADFVGVEDEDAGKFYRYDLKTNKKKSNHQTLLTLLAALNGGGLTKDRLAELVDMENFLSYAAVSWVLGNPDDLRNNYNNCYIYFRGDTGQLMVIPYDYDRCLGVTKEWDSTGHGMTTDDYTNIVLPAGKYQVVFDSADGSITVHTLDG